MHTPMWGDGAKRRAVSGKAGNQQRSWQGRGKRGLVCGGRRKYLELPHLHRFDQGGTVSRAINPEGVSLLLNQPPPGQDQTLQSAQLCPKGRGEAAQGCEIKGQCPPHPAAAWSSLRRNRVKEEDK